MQYAKASQKPPYDVHTTWYIRLEDRENYTATAISDADGSLFSIKGEYEIDPIGIFIMGIHRTFDINEWKFISMTEYLRALEIL